MTMLKPLAIFAITSALLTTAISSPLPGQDTAPPPQSSQPQAPDVDWDAESEKNSDAIYKQSLIFQTQLSRLIDLHFDGELTIEQYVEMIQEAQGAERLNVLIADELRNTALPSCHLRRVTVRAAFELLPRLTGNEAITVGIEFANEGQQREAADLVSISRDNRFTADIGTQIYPIKRILETVKPESLLQTLERGIQFSDVGSPKVQIALEAETGLLFVKGTTAQLDVVRDVLNAIGINNISFVDGGGMGGGGMGGGGMGGGGMGGMGGPGGGLGGESSQFFDCGNYSLRITGGKVFIFVDGEGGTPVLLESPEGAEAMKRALNAAGQSSASGGN